MTIIYEKETGEVLYKGSKPVNYEDRKPVYKVTTNPETGDKTKEIVGYTIFYNPEFFATAEVPDTFREKTYNQ